MYLNSIGSPTPFAIESELARLILDEPGVAFVAV
jgi:hypothetical protein